MYIQINPDKTGKAFDIRNLLILLFLFNSTNLPIYKYTLALLLYSTSQNKSVV